MKIVNEYLAYIMLTEREWDTSTENPDTFVLQTYADLISQKTNIGALKKLRHALQPSLYDIYIKNSLGDYRGRPDMMNNKSMRHIGFKEFQRDLKILKKKIKYAQKIKQKRSKNFFKDASNPG